MYVFVNAQGIKTVYVRKGEGIKKWQNFVHVAVECLLRYINLISPQRKHFLFNMKTPATSA